MNLETTRPRHRPRNRWQDEVREDGRVIGREEWQKKLYNREEWKLMRTARNRRILHVNGIGIQRGYLMQTKSGKRATEFLLSNIAYQVHAFIKNHFNLMRKI
jgi:hypothetical protein